jgi:hypothetical protein
MKKPQKEVDHHQIKYFPKDAYHIHKKDIKTQARKQLKGRFPNWHRLNRKEKKGIAHKVLDEAVDNCDYPKEI